MAGKGKGKGKGRSKPRNIRRHRRGTVKVTHSALATIFGIGVAAAPLVSTTSGPAGNVPAGQSPLVLAQQGNWGAALWALGANVGNNWALYLFAIVPVIIIAVLARKFGARLKLSKHWTV